MPLYEYACRQCRHEFEALVRPQDPAPRCKASMSSSDQTRAYVKAERKRRLPQHRAEQNEEYQHTLREHLHDE